MTNFTPPGIYPPGDDFRRASGDRASLWESVDLDLSVAHTKERIGVMGASVIFCDIKAWDSESVLSTTKTPGVAQLYPYGKNTPGKPLTLVAGIKWGTGQFDAADEFYFSNEAQANKMLRVFFSRGPNVELSSADVSISGSINTQEVFPDPETAAARTFMGGGEITGGATLFPHFLLLNPTGSAKKVYVSSIRPSPNNACIITIISHNVALTTALDEFNKSLGGAAPSCTVSGQTIAPASSPGTIIMEDAYRLVDSDGRNLIGDSAHPIVLDANEGILIRCDTANITMSMLFDWIEQAA